MSQLYCSNCSEWVNEPKYEKFGEQRSKWEAFKKKVCPQCSHPLSKSPKSPPKAIKTDKESGLRSHPLSKSPPKAIKTDKESGLRAACFFLGLVQLFFYYVLPYIIISSNEGLPARIAVLIALLTASSIAILFVKKLAKILNRSPFGWAIFTFFLAYTPIILAVSKEKPSQITPTAIKKEKETSLRVACFFLGLVHSFSYYVLPNIISHEEGLHVLIVIPLSGEFAC